MATRLSNRSDPVVPPRRLRRRLVALLLAIAAIAGGAAVVTSSMSEAEPVHVMPDGSRMSGSGMR